MNELLQDLRVALPGVQMLFGFLLTIPFDQRFEHLSPAQKLVYWCAVMSTACATAFYIAPSVYHRIHEREHEGHEGELKKVFSILAIIGGVFLAASLTLAIALVSSFLFGNLVSGIVTGVIGVLVLSLWYALPLLMAYKHKHWA